MAARVEIPFGKKDFQEMEQVQDYVSAQKALTQFSVDPKLDDIARISKLAASGVLLQRLVQIKCIKSVCERDDFNSVRDVIIPLMITLAQDQEKHIQTALFDQLPPLVLILHYHDANLEEKTMNSLILPMFKRYVESHTELEDHVLNAFVGIVKSTNQHVFRNILLPFLIFYSQYFQPAQTVITIQLIVGCISVISSEDCKIYISPLIRLLCLDSDVQVRKYCLEAISGLSGIVGPSITEEVLLEPFLMMCMDACWPVRSKAACVMSTMLSSIMRDEWYPVCVYVINQLLDDKHPCVQFSMLKHYGSCLAYLPSNLITSAMVETFVSLANSPQDDSEQTLKFSCVFNFSAVMKALGADRFNEIQAQWTQLRNENSPKIRRCFAASMHEMAGVLGQSKYSKHIVDTVLATKPSDHPVMEALLEHLGDTIVVMKEADQKTLLDYMMQLFSGLQDMSANGKEWRQRHALAKQIPILCNGISNQDITTFILPLTLQLLVDPVDSVRAQIVNSLNFLLQRLVDMRFERLTELFESIINVMSKGSYNYRQMFVNICPSLVHILPPGVFATMFSPAWVAMVRDPVVNVREAVFNTVVQNTDDPVICEALDRQKVLATLQKDPYSPLAQSVVAHIEKLKKGNSAS